MRRFAGMVSVQLLVGWVSVGAAAFEPSAYEEPGGVTFSFACCPSEGVYGIGYGDGTWLVGTPVFGDYAVSLFSNGRDAFWFCGVGMTLRLLPHWRVAPFAGVGGAYNYILSSGRSGSAGDSGSSHVGSPVVEQVSRDAEGSYWTGHAEVGLRIGTASGGRFLELVLRHVLPSSIHEESMTLAGLVFGTVYER